MWYGTAAVVGGTALGLGLASRWLRHTPITEPLVALLVGILAGRHVLGVVDVGDDAVALLRDVTLVVLAMSMMSAALRHRFSLVVTVVRPVLVLILVVLPFTALVSGLLALLVGLPLGTAAVLGSVVAPTDPVLGSNAVTGHPAVHQVPERLRAVISVEAATNEAVAHVVFVVTVAIVVDASSAAGEIIREVATVGASAAAGAVVGWSVGRLLVASERAHDIEHAAFLTLTLSLVALVLGGAVSLDGQPVVAVLAAGLAYARELPAEAVADEREVQEAINRYLTLPVFVLLGAALPWSGWIDLGWAAFGVATVIPLGRRLPLVHLMRRPLGLGRAGAAFTGWAGPVGVGTLYLLCVAAREHGLESRLWAFGTLVVAVSVLLHGASAASARRAYVRATRRQDA